MVILPMKKALNISINLLPKDPFLASPIGKILQWALSVGRYIVIFTELIVIISFITRFSLDRQITDLNEKIFQKKTVIQSYGDLEPKVRLAQQKTQQYDQLADQANLSEVFPQLTAIIPQGVSLNELTVQPGSITFTGTAQSENSFNLLVNNLQVSPDFNDIVVNSITTNKDQQRNPGFEFKIEAKTTQPTPVPVAPAQTQTAPQPADPQVM